MNWKTKRYLGIFIAFIPMIIAVIKGFISLGCMGMLKVLFLSFCIPIFFVGFPLVGMMIFFRSEEDRKREKK